MSKYKLIRERDSLTNTGDDLDCIRWNESGSFLGFSDKIDVGVSIRVKTYTGRWWLTTPILSIEVNKPEYKKFTTQNSVYELFDDTSIPDFKDGLTIKLYDLDSKKKYKKS